MNNFTTPYNDSIQETHYFTVFYGTDNETSFKTLQEAEDFLKECYTFNELITFYDNAGQVIPRQTDDQKTYTGAREYYDQAKYMKLDMSSMVSLKDEAKQCGIFLDITIPAVGGNYIFSNSEGWKPFKGQLPFE